MSKEKSRALLLVMAGMLLWLSGGQAFISHGGTPTLPSTHNAGGMTYWSSTRASSMPSGSSSTHAFQRVLGCTSVLLLLAATRVGPERRRKGTSTKAKAAACELSMKAMPMPKPSAVSTQPTMVALETEFATSVSDLIDMSPAVPVVSVSAQADIFVAVPHFGGEAASVPMAGSTHARKAARRVGSARCASRKRSPGVARHAAATGYGAQQERRRLGARLSSGTAFPVEEFALRYDSSLKSQRIQQGLQQATKKSSNMGKKGRAPSGKRSSALQVDFMTDYVINLRNGMLVPKRVMHLLIPITFAGTCAMPASGTACCTWQ